jgi:hypothetical protein
MVVDFVDANVARDSFLRLIFFGTKAPCARHDRMHPTRATGLHESGIVGATAKTATVSKLQLFWDPCSEILDTTDWSAGTFVVLTELVEFLFAADTLLEVRFVLVASSAATTSAIS